MGLQKFIGRQLQIGKLGLTAAQIQKTSDEEKKTELSLDLAHQMASLRGVPQKFGQILSLGELNSDSSVFSTLTESALPEAAEQSFSWIEAELGQSISQVFRSLDPEGHPASLGQVHRGIMKDGTEVAVKIQYPGMREILESDLKSLGLIALPLSAKQSGFDLKAYKNELRNSLLNELDYQREAAALGRFRYHLEDIPDLEIPRVINGYNTNKLLIMSWVPGLKFQKIGSWKAETRERIARLLLSFFLHAWLKWKEIHADPHSGNFRLIESTTEPRLGVIDFGCVKQINEQESLALRLLIESDPSSTSSDLATLYHTLGFKQELMEPLESKLPELTQILLEPFRTKGPFQTKNWSLGKRINKLLGDDRWNFRFAGPASLVLFVRTLSGVIQYLQALDVALDWSKEFEGVQRNSIINPLSLQINPGDQIRSQASQISLRSV